MRSCVSSSDSFHLDLFGLERQESREMTQESPDKLAAVVEELREHLKFFRDIGVEDIGDSKAARLHRPESREPGLDEPGVRLAKAQDGDRPETRMDLPSPPRETASAPLQSGLFGDVAEDRSKRVAVSNAPPPAHVDASLEEIRNDIGECRRCRLHEKRTNIVFGEGNPRARLVFVGEGPGAEEDLTGRPFVGRAGQLLDKIIEAIGMRRDEVYIANIVKCRPPGNRTPERDEVATCEPFLLRQLAFIKPEVIVALGSPAFQCLLRTREPITRARGQWREWNGIKVMPTFHPAYLLRSPDKKREAWEDIKKVRDYLANLV